MNKTTMKRYRTLLTQQLTTLLDHNEGTVEQLELETKAHADPNDRASAESGSSFDLRLRDRDRTRSTKIREALQRIDEGTFGICEDCGQRIDDRRLSARPVTSQCIECKEDQERRERREKNQLPEAPASVEAPKPARSRRRA